MKPAIFGPSKDLMSNEARAAKMLDARRMSELGAGFKGLAGRTAMQAEMFRGNTPGASNAFSAGNRYGAGKTGRWAGPEMIGGLGEKRRLRTSGGDDTAKKNLEVQKTQEEHLADISRNITQSLSVN